MAWRKANSRVEYFAARHVKQANGCWRWTGVLNAKGYGRMSVDGKVVFAHRYAYEAKHGPIPEGVVLDHLCRLRACVNPAHLEPVPPKENTQRGNAMRMNRHAAQRGLSWQERRVMTADEYLLTLHQLGLSMAAAARYLGVSSRTARRYGAGDVAIPEAFALLLRVLVEFNVKPIVPAWTEAWEKRQ